MKIKEIRTEEDINGIHKVIEYTNGVCVKMLRKPSKYYTDKMAARAEESRILREQKEAQFAQEKLIKDKMREIALRELTEEGKI